MIKSVRFRCFIIAVFALLTALSLLASQKVGINYDIADYLDSHSDTKVAMNLIEDEFGLTGSLQIMIKGVSAEEANGVKRSLAAIDGVKSVVFDGGDESCYKDGCALFSVITDGDDYSAEALAVSEKAEELLAKDFGESVYFGGGVYEKQSLRSTITSEMVFILTLSLSLVVVILLITSQSWLEPFILLAASGIAVFINRGSNVFLGEISYITNSVAAILQLALSIDYSIILLSTYRALKGKCESNGEAMSKAIRACLKPVSASGLTTVAGLLALLFMSFRIGFDIGLVLIKGIVISAITAMTLFPALILLCDKLLIKTKKKEFVPHGVPFTKLALKAGKVIVPVALALIIVCGVLQTSVVYNFTAAGAEDDEIRETFGRSNQVAVVYPSASDEAENEFIKRMADFRTEDGKGVLVRASAYANTVRESYTVEKACQKLSLSRSDAAMLFASYALDGGYGYGLTLKDFVSEAQNAIKSGEAGSLAGDGTLETLKKLGVAADIMTGENTASQLYAKLTDGLIGKDELDELSVMQIYGTAFYGTLDDRVDFSLLLNMISLTSGSESVKSLLGEDEVKALRTLALKASQFDMKASADEAFLAENRTFYDMLHSACTARTFAGTASELYEFLTGESMNVSLSEDVIQQIFIIYFRLRGQLGGSMTGREFVSFVLDECKDNTVISSRLTEKAAEGLKALSAVGDATAGGVKYDFASMHKTLSMLSGKIASETEITEDAVKGVYVYGLSKSLEEAYAIHACDLLAYVKANAESGLFAGRISEEMSAKIAEADEAIKQAEPLFRSESYSRMLLAISLPNESSETNRFTRYTNTVLDEAFGENAYAAGEIYTVSDMQSSFGSDTRMINIFTVVSIFLIVTIIFRSLSLPVLLVAIIQGAIWIALSTGLLSGGPTFFMSYIIATCILMGTTIDYGILMSSNYVAFRSGLSKADSLAKSLEAAMPTVFSSGMILTVCGFVIAFISTQSAIATVGLLIGKGALVSVIMITLVLPSVLYVLDAFILKLSLRK